MIRTALSFGVLFMVLLAGSKWLHQSQVSTGESAQPTAERAPPAQATSSPAAAKPIGLGKAASAAQVHESNIRLVAFDEPLDGLSDHVKPAVAVGRVADDD